MEREISPHCDKNSSHNVGDKYRWIPLLCIKTFNRLVLFLKHWKYQNCKDCLYKMLKVDFSFLVKSVSPLFLSLVHLSAPKNFASRDSNSPSYFIPRGMGNQGIRILHSSGNRGSKRQSSGSSGNFGELILLRIAYKSFQLRFSCHFFNEYSILKYWSTYAKLY